MYFECSILKHFQAEEEKIRKEEEERREHEEYLKLKEAFSIEEEGEEDVGPDLSVSCLPLITVESLFNKSTKFSNSAALYHKNMKFCYNFKQFTSVWKKSKILKYTRVLYFRDFFADINSRNQQYLKMALFSFLEIRADWLKWLHCRIWLNGALIAT